MSGPESTAAWLDVRKGRLWTGAGIPVDLTLRGGALILTVGSHRLDKKERSALVRLCGDEVLSTLIAKREPPQIALPLRDLRIRCPRLIGGGTMLLEARGRPPAALKFVDPAETGDPLANPMGFTMRLLRAGPAARRRRNAWRERIEAAYRSSAVPS